ncbi:TRM11 family SAM-dependent methyltransferase [Bacillus solitudinis]|uniref:TRM11 family SAM-dependent methyltransferase n=1 Tax=Bacillus solitudinis TaxID=2014074 RepID=UPI001D0D3E3E|nr:RNA methyltransferase [Bacillus solitudinis]
MEKVKQKAVHYLYTYSCHEDERSLSQLEMRSLFGSVSESSIIESPIRIKPSRSPFIRERIDVIYKGKCLDDILRQCQGFQPIASTFKVIFVKNDDLPKDEIVVFEERRKIERDIGLQIQGKVDLLKPKQLYAIMKLKEGWVFGQYVKGESIWLKHQRKPQNYSTALSTRVARAVVNIAVPNPKGRKVIDPCCGIGTVLIEALSMHIEIVGSDINPLAAIGARENIAYFDLYGEVMLKDIRNVIGDYDVAIIDMPYNLCSVLDPTEQLEMLQSARRFADKVVVVTIEPIDDLLKKSGFTIVDRCVAKKARFSREIIVCE